MGGYCCLIKNYKVEETDIKFIETEMNDLEKEQEQLKRVIKRLNLKKKELELIFKKNQKKFDDYNNEIKNQINNLNKYKEIIEDLNNELNEYNNIFRLSIYDFNNSDTNNIINEDYELLFNEFKNILNKINNLSININNLQKTDIYNIENKYNNIQKNFDEILKNDKNNSSFVERLETNNELINENLKEYEEIINDLENKKNLYNYIDNEIEGELKDIIIKIKEYGNKAENLKKTINNEKEIQKNDKVDETIIIEDSLLLTYKFSNDIFSSKVLFDNEDSDNKEFKGLIRKNWDEIVYIYNEYDVHDIIFDLTAVNIPPKSFYDSYNIGFNNDKYIEIIELKIEGKEANYIFKNNLIKFNINLGNNESNKILLKYKEYPIMEKLTEGEINERKFSRNDLYGLSKKLKGQKVKFTLCINSDFEVINFEEEFLIKTNDKEYSWGGIVPQEGKKTRIKLSKLEAKFSFNIYKKIETINKEPIERLKFLIPLCFEGGNNKLININYSSNQTNQIQLKKEKKECEINYINIQQNFAEFSIKGELINKCKGEWSCDLSDEEIENEIPDDFKKNKIIFKQKAEKIIEEYNIEHKDDLVKITDFAKIGKWIKKNIEYDEEYIGKNNITATDTLKNKKGVCDHFTKLYNAFIYSLGYKCIYVSGYVIDKRDIFEKEDYHCWTLIKINGKWLPFDATWGIFSGKLPVSHIFEGFFSKGINTKGTNKIKFVENKTYVKYIE